MKVIDYIKNRKLLFSILGLFLVISFVSISYASMNTSMMITGDAYVRVDEEIRVVGIKFLNVENDAYETYNAKYSKNSTNMYITLPNINSKITYQVEIENKSDHVYLVSDITGNLINPNITYTVENDVVKVVPKKSKITVNITFQFEGEVLPSDITQIATINYKFERPTASHLEFDNTGINTECRDVQCALDELYGKFSPPPVAQSKYVEAYTYNQTKESNDYCVTGEESTCKKTTCYNNKSIDSCAPGTIIRYQVNDNEDKWFFVLHDDGKTITMQQRSNTVNSVKWYSSDDNHYGPTIALSALESATSSWSNVENQTYQMGTTNFNKTNAYTGCGLDFTCTTNTYTLGSRTGKARMITYQEAMNLGCKIEEVHTCPIFMNNYLKESTSHEGTVNATTDFGYWTMSASAFDSTMAFRVGQAGRVYYNLASEVNISAGARAVIVVSK